MENFNVPQPRSQNGIFHPVSLKDDVRSDYRRWWIGQVTTEGMANGKLYSHKEFKTAFATSPYLNSGPAYLRPMTLKFWCSDHRLDIELGRRNHTLRTARSCRFCTSDHDGDEYQAFQCSYFMDLQVVSGIDVTTRSLYRSLMENNPIKVRRYIAFVTSRIKFQ